LYDAAESRYAQGQYSFALALYDEYLLKYPTAQRVPDAQYRRAVSLFRLERYGESLGLLDLIQRRYRTTRYLSHVPFWQGVSHYELGQYDRAIAALRTYLAGETAQDLARQALVYKAVAEVATDRLEAARETLQGLDGQGGSYAGALRAYVLLRERRYEDLLAYADQVDSSSLEPPWGDRFQLYRAEALWETGRTEAAEAIYRVLWDTPAETSSVAIRRLFVASSRRNDVAEMEDLVQLAERKFAASPEILSDMWVRLGVENYQRGSLDLAESLLRRVWNLRDRQSVGSVVALHLAEIYLVGGDAARAAATLEQALDLGQEPRGPLLMRLGDLDLAAGNPAEAAARYGAYLSENTGSERFGEATYLLAFTRSRLGDNPEALRGVQDYLASEPEGKFRREAEKLRVVLLRRLGRLPEAAAALEEIVRRYPEDTRARLDQLKVLYALEQYLALLSQADILFRTFPALAATDAYTHVVGRYLQGLALVSSRRYQEAEGAFATIAADQLRTQGLEVISPDLLYYRGWSLYRLNRFEEAVARFREAVDGFPDHPGQSRALYMAGYASYAGGRFTDAAGYFRRVGQAAGDATLGARALFYLGKSLLNAGDKVEAIDTLVEMVGRYPGSDLIDDSLLEQGLTLAEVGQVDRAVATLARVPREYPSSALAEESMYQVGQVLFKAGRWTDSRDAFSAFRNQYPRSALYDAALYWGGLASLEAGERLGALLLWEQNLIPVYRSSPFRPDALWRSAAMAAESAEYEKALRLTVELMTDHPEEAKALGASERAGELRYLILGLGEREAELSAQIERQRGVATRSGREAMVSLARIYLSGQERKLDLAYQLLAQIVDRPGSDERATADTAQYLIGEYFFRKNDPARARDEFLKAALRDPTDRDLAAASLFRAAEMSALAGRRDDVATLVRRLTDTFPTSSWAQEGRRLLAGGTQ
jgi:TolA-binding protein